MFEFKKGELFSGPGGLALASKRANVIDNNGEKFSIKHVWANDYDKFSCETFRKNICDKNPESVFCSKVEELDIEKLKPIDAFCFGFPCNDFSVVGEKKGTNGYFGKLYKYGIEIINKFNPKWFLAENVPGLKQTNGGADFNNILEELKSAGMGYNLTPHLYKFEEYGVPQLRRRIIIVGIRKDLGLSFKVPEPTTKNKYKTASEALFGLKEDVPNNEMIRHNKTVIERLNCIPPGENAWYDGIPEHLRIKAGKAKLSQIYRRLHPDKPSYTVTASGGGGTYGYHWLEPRALTNRERARLQTFPDDYVFCGELDNVRKQIGMAVPPDGAQIIFEAILKTFAKIDYNYVEPTLNL